MSEIILSNKQKFVVSPPLLPTAHLSFSHNLRTLTFEIIIFIFEKYIRIFYAFCVHEMEVEEEEEEEMKLMH